MGMKYWPDDEYDIIHSQHNDMLIEISHLSMLLGLYSWNYCFGEQSPTYLQVCKYV